MNPPIVLLNFDGTLQKQTQLKNYPMEWIDFSDLTGCQGYCETAVLKKIEQRLRKRKFRGMTLIGNGNYHYVTYLLLAEIKRPFSLILFDHHTDLAPSDDVSVISCGSWVTFAIKTLPFLQHVVIIGASTASTATQSFTHQLISETITVIPEDEVKQSSLPVLEQKIHSILQKQPVYISVDKDVLDKEDAATNWDQGSMSLKQLLYLLHDLKTFYPILGVDICGELPLSPIDILSPKWALHIEKNEFANRAIVDILSAS